MTFQFESLAAFFVMGGHGGFVWVCYAVTVTALVLLAYLPGARHRKALRDIKNQQKRAAARAAGSDQQQPKQQEVSS